jgi:ATP-binding cassette subfamily A (ABC1) protein 3
VFENLASNMRIIYKMMAKVFARNQQTKFFAREDSLACDEDVENEKKKIDNMFPTAYRNYNLLMKNVSKYYDDFLAVNEICVGIQSSECFGLLG